MLVWCVISNYDDLIMCGKVPMAGLMARGLVLLLRFDFTFLFAGFVSRAEPKSLAWLQLMFLIFIGRLNFEGSCLASLLVLPDFSSVAWRVGILCVAKPPKGFCLGSAWLEFMVSSRESVM